MAQIKERSFSFAKLSELTGGLVFRSVEPVKNYNEDLKQEFVYHVKALADGIDDMLTIVTLQEPSGIERNEEIEFVDATYHVKGVGKGGFNGSVFADIMETYSAQNCVKLSELQGGKKDSAPKPSPTGKPQTPQQPIKN